MNETNPLEPKLCLSGDDAAKWLKLIQDTAVRASGSEGKAHVLTIPNGDRPVHVMVTGDEIDPIDILPTLPRNTVLTSVSHLPSYLEWAETVLDSHPTVWVGEAAIAVVLQDTPESDRKDRAIIPLNPTPAFAFLSAEGSRPSPQSFEHKKFVQILIRKLGDCLGDEERELVTRLRKMRFSATSAGSSSVGQGNASYGLDIENKAWSELGPIPEQITLSVKLYADPALKPRRQIVCGLDVDSESKTFSIYPLAGQIEQAEADERETIRSLLNGEALVFDGTP